MHSVFGIDLGTTFSGIAYIDADEQFHIIHNIEGQRFTPSAVYFEPSGQISVGRAAILAAPIAPDRVVTSAKRRMGEADWLWEFDGRFFRAADISAIILKQLKAEAERATGETVERIVLTVPAHFNELQRTETIEAATIAGLHVERLLNEPTAAALAFGHQDLEGENSEGEGWMLIVDLGGGTCDVTLLEAQNDALHIRATSGHAMLGGEDWDDLLLHHAAAHFVSHYGVDPLDDPMAYQQLREQCIAAKHTLSAAPEASLLLAYDGHQLHFNVTQETFCAWSASLLGQMEDLCTMVLAECGRTWKDLSRLLLVGGASKMPMVQNKLQEHVQTPIISMFRADEAVLLGAALQAAALGPSLARPITSLQKRSPKYVSGQVEASDITAHSLGLLILDRQHTPTVDVIIPKHSPLPHLHNETYFTAHDNQTSIRLQMVEGESPVPEECVQLGEVELTGIPPRPAGQRIEISFRYDESGLLSLALHDVGAGLHHEITFQRPGARSIQELEQMRRMLLVQHINPKKPA